MLGRWQRHGAGPPPPLVDAMMRVLRALLYRRGRVDQAMPGEGLQQPISAPTRTSLHFACTGAPADR